MCSLAILMWLRVQSSSCVLPRIGVGVYAAALAVASPPQGRLIDGRGRTLCSASARRPGSWRQ
jgi:hypothetical protein